MNAKINKDLNQEILIGETTSEELSDEALANVSGGLTLNFVKISYDFASIKFDYDLTSLSNKSSLL